MTGYKIKTIYKWVATIDGIREIGWYGKKGYDFNFGYLNEVGKPTDDIYEAKWFETKEEAHKYIVSCPDYADWLDNWQPHYATILVYHP